MMTLHIALCDDDSVALKNEAKLLESIFREKSVKCDLEVFHSPFELLEKDIFYDMAFLDIEMDGMNGIDLARAITMKKKDCHIFFLTNYSVYLDNAFDVNAVRYLTKPVDRQRLSSGIDRVLEKIDETIKIIKVINHENKLPVEISIPSVIYIENVSRRTHIVLTEYDFVADELFSSLKNKIEKEVNYFAMPHQSFFVNLKYVKGHSKDGVKLSYAGKNYTTDMSRRQFYEFSKKIVAMAKIL